MTKSDNEFSKVMRESETFEEFVSGLSKIAEGVLTSQDSLEPVLVIVGEREGWILDVPDGAQEMAAFFVNAVETYRENAKWYAFLTETWALSFTSDDPKEIQRYLNDPGLIASHPLKTERVSFKAQSKDSTIEGYIPFERDDSGTKIIGEVVISDSPGEDYANVANLLEPMVQ